MAFLIPETIPSMKSRPHCTAWLGSDVIKLIADQNPFRTVDPRLLSAFPIPEKTRGASIYNCLQALEALAAVVEQGGVGAGVFHGNAAAENDAGLRVVGDAAGDVQGGVNRFGQARQSRCAAA